MPAPAYRFGTLYSGSKGNAAYLETPGARILIDAGKSARTLTAALASIGVDMASVDAVFITHEHSDHVAALETLCRKYAVPVHMLYASALRYKDTQPEALCRCLQLHREAPFSVVVGDVTVAAFETSHDSRASVGYRLSFPGADGETVHLALATDTGYVPDTVRTGLSGCEAVVLESNHDEELLMAGPYPYDLKLRIKSPRGHLSNRACADLCTDLALAGTRHILLAHLSEENNAPAIAYDETFSATGGGVHLEVADPAAPVLLVGDPARPIEKKPRREREAPAAADAAALMADCEACL